MKDYKYHAYVCNNALYGVLVSLKASGVSEENMRTMMKRVGDALAKMSFVGKPIDYYIKHIEEWNRIIESEAST